VEWSSAAKRLKEVSSTGSVVDECSIWMIFVQMLDFCYLDGTGTRAVI